MTTETIPWTEESAGRAVGLLAAAGGLVVSPTKVGYILMTSDGVGLDRKFEAKVRRRDKPGVVLVTSLDQLRTIAQLDPEIESLYQRCWDEDVLLGCILPWTEAGLALLPDDEVRELAMDRRGTSCFVVKFGRPSEEIATALWRDHGRFSFASSANPSGEGNRGVVAGVGERILDRADLVVEADAFVASNQPDATVETRYEQGVMVSMVDEAGALVPRQEGRRQVAPAPTLIRRGLAVDRIMSLLAETFPRWDYRHGQYY